ncbi:MAG: hypothetical protein ACOC1F_12310 [Myxococcota bacterium]
MKGPIDQEMTSDLLSLLAGQLDDLLQIAVGLNLDDAHGPIGLCWHSIHKYLGSSSAFTGTKAESVCTKDALVQHNVSGAAKEAMTISIHGRTLLPPRA